MAEDTKIGGSTGNMQQLMDALNKPAAAASAASDATAKKKANEAMGQQEFLSLLVNQLQHQDPLNPMDSQEFSVQLAQFSQLEQLISINKNLSEGGSGSISNMTSFLGHEVMLKDGAASVEKGQGPNVVVDIPEGLQSMRLDVISPEGGVAQSLSIDATKLEAGKRVIGLDNLTVPDGDYTLRLVAVDEQGAFKDLPHKITGTVEGVVMEPEPRLLVNGREVSLDEISEVLQG